MKKYNASVHWSVMKTFFRRKEERGLLGGGSKLLTSDCAHFLSNSAKLDLIALVQFFPRLVSSAMVSPRPSSVNFAFVGKPVSLSHPLFLKKHIFT